MQDRAEVAALKKTNNNLHAHCELRAAVSWFCCKEGQPAQSGSLTPAFAVALAHLGLQSNLSKTSLPVVSMPIILLTISLSNVSFVD